MEFLLKFPFMLSQKKTEEKGVAWIYKKVAKEHRKCLKLETSKAILQEHHIHSLIITYKA